MVNAGRILIIAQGQWNSLTSYSQLDLVSFNKMAYLARQASVGVDPSTDTSMTYWQPFGSSVEPDGETIITDPDGNLAVNIDGTTLVYDVDEEVLKAVLSVSDLSNVAISNLLDGQVLAYNSTTHKFENVDIATSLDSLTDVDISSAANGQVIGYNSTTQKWENIDQSGGLLPHLIIISDTGSTVTVTKGTTVISAPETSTGHFECDIPEFGTWTIDSLLAGDDAQITLVVDTVKVYTVDDSHFYASITVTFPSGATCRCYGGDENYYASTTPYTFTVHSANTFTVTATNGTATDTKTVTITTSGQSESVSLNFIPNGSTVTPVGNIQTWLHCANIWDKNYTSISQVLADASTLQALIASNNAADYMVRSTTWASDVTANSSAMTYIGANDYCADALLADSTWLNAICNSTYFENVLNVKVPTMTSNTTPSGVASASSIYGTQFEAFRAFDGVENPNQNGWYASPGTAAGWIQYMFTSGVKVFKVRYVQRTSDPQNNLNQIHKGAILGSNDGTNFTQIYSIDDSGLPATQGVVTHNFKCEISYQYIRLKIDSLRNTGTQAEPIIGELQFYCRAV